MEDKPHGRPPGVRKVTLKAMEAVRRLQQNPHLGEFRIHAALAQIGIHLSPRTCGRILALNRELYGPEKPKGPVKEKREMPFAARRRHQYWSADVRYLKGHKPTPRSTGPTGSGKTAADRPRRLWASSRAFVTARRSSRVPSSRLGSCGSWTL